MNSKFTQGFTKTAGLAGTALGLAGKGAKAVGKGLLWAGGGKVNTALNVASAAGTYGDISDQMRQAAQR